MYVYELGLFLRAVWNFDIKSIYTNMDPNLDDSQGSRFKKAKDRSWASSSRGSTYSNHAHYVMAQHPTTKQSIKAIVLKTRTSINPGTSNKTDSNERLDYYVRFDGQDKRNDCWLPYSKIKETKEKVEKTDNKEEK